ncbi:DTW domain-containing protein [bacterium]|nr:DTW domain-containing protein [bacterium]
MRECPTPESTLQASCEDCWKTVELCVCESKPQVRTPLQLLILQHPREARNPLGSARLLSLSIAGAVHCVGLSWRSLSQAFGEKQDPSEWAVLYLGTQKDSESKQSTAPLEIRDRKGRVVPKATLKGIVLLDGNWKQSKTLWWRNPWLLKLNRLLLNPTQGSKYGSLRRQPRGRCLSTLEAGAVTLDGLGDTKSAQALLEHFDAFLEKARVNRPAKASPPAPSRRLPAPVAQPAASAD